MVVIHFKNKKKRISKEENKKYLSKLYSKSIFSMFKKSEKRILF